LLDIRGTISTLIFINVSEEASGVRLIILHNYRRPFYFKGQAPNCIATVCRTEIDRISLIPLF
jgi:hypothetical protein